MKNSADDDVAGEIQIDIVVEVCQVSVCCGALLGRLIFGERDAVKTLQSWFAMVHPYTPLAPLVLPILQYHLIEPIQGMLLLVKGFPEFFPGEMSKPVVIITVVYVAVQLHRARRCLSQ